MEHFFIQNVAKACDTYGLFVIAKDPSTVVKLAFEGRKVPKHIKNCGVRKRENNNRIERMNGTLRERVKVQRGWKSY